MRFSLTASLISLAVFIALTAAPVAPVAAAEPAKANETTSAALWAALKSGGHVILIRHASTVPGTGDPPGFVLGDCATQRNLSDAGRAEAKQIGATFRERGVPIGNVMSSRWCRCLDTARLAFDKVRVQPWASLDSHFDNPSNGAVQAASVKTGLAKQEIEGSNLVLVTHQVNITALTGIYPAQGEAVIAKRAGRELRVLGRLNPVDAGRSGYNDR